MAAIQMKELLEAGAHFGHQTKRWNPKMKKYIFGARNSIYIIDLQKTLRLWNTAANFLTKSASEGKNFLFVATKPQAQELIAEQAARCGAFYVNNRWLGGTLTNFQTVKKSIDRLNGLEKARSEGRFDLLTKKEALDLNRRIEKMNRSLAGIKQMKGLPGMMFVVDPKREYIAIREANALRIPVVGLCDTNCDPDGISYVIPGNDDALKSIRLFTTAIADAALEGNMMGRDEAGGSMPQSDMGDIEIFRRRAEDDGSGEGGEE